MGIGYIELASYHGTSFHLRVQACLTVHTVIERVQSRFRKDGTKRDEHLLKMLQTVSNHKSSGHPTML